MKEFSLNFIKQTAKDYDMDEEEVSNIAFKINYDMEIFYKKLEKNGELR